MRWWRFVSAMELRKILAYRSDFWITFLAQTFIQLFIARALWQSIFEAKNVTEMNGFTLSTMTLYYLIVPLGTRILSGENIGFISREIYDGTFTRYLIYPLSFFQYKIVTYLTHSFFYGLQLFLMVGIFAIFSSEPFPLERLMNLIPGVLLFFLAALAYVLMAAMVELIALWADNVWTLMVMMRFFTSFLGGGLVPLDFFPVWSRELLSFTPFPYLISLPVKVSMGLVGFDEALQGVMILLIWVLLFASGSVLIWNRGQKNYTGVGI